MKPLTEIVKFKCTLIASHRGDNRLGPENTIIAFKEAIENGVDMIEMDIQFTKDKKIIVFHNDEIELGDKIYKIIDLNYEDIKKYKIYYNLEDGTKTYTNIPLLYEVFDNFKDKVYFITEIKNNFDDDNIESINNLCNFIIKNNLQKELVITSFDIKNLLFIKNKYPLLLTAVIYEPNSNILPSKYKKQLNCNAFICDINELTEKFVLDANKNNIFIGVYGANTKELIKKAINYNVRFIGTDCIDLLKNILNEIK